MKPPKDASNSVTHQSLYPGVPTPYETPEYHPYKDRKTPSPDTPPSTPFSSKNKKATENEEVENGMDVRFIPPSDNYDLQQPALRRTRHWIRATGTITDPRAHVMALAYMSDSFLLGTALAANQVRFADVTMMVSLDHTVYFHRPVRADEWLMHCVESPWTGNDRGLVIGRFFSKEGEHVATVFQEGLIRKKREENGGNAVQGKL